MQNREEKTNFYWNSGSFIIVAFLNFMTYTLALWCFKPEIFGFYLLLSAVWNVGNNIDFGFGVSMVKNISENLKLKNVENINRIFATFIFVYSLLGLSIAFGFFAYSFIFVINSSLINSFSFIDVKLMFLFLFLSFIFKYASIFYVKVLEGFGKYVFISKVNILFSFTLLLMVIIIYKFELSIEFYVLSYLINNFLLLVVLQILLPSRTNRIIAFSIKKINLKILKEHGLYNLNIQASFFLNSLIDPLIKYILGFSIGVQYVTFFETGKRIIDLSNGLIFSGMKGLLNKLSEANAVNELKSFLDTRISYYSNIGITYSILVYGILNPILSVLIMLWFKNIETLIIFSIFVIPYVLINFGGPVYSALMIEGKGGRIAILQLSNLLMTTAFLLISIKLFDSYIGLIGFLAATIFNNFLMFHFARKYLDFDIKLFVNNIHLKQLLILIFSLTVQGVLIYLYQQYLYIILTLFFILYLFLFNKQLSYFINLFIKEVRVYFNLGTKLRESNSIK